MGTDRMSMRATNNNMSVLTSTLYRKRIRRYHETQLLSTKYINCILDPNTEERVSHARMATLSCVTTLSCVIPRVKCSGLTSFLYQGVCHWNNLPLEIKQCPSKDTFKYQVKCLLYSRLFVQETSLYVRS